MIFYFSGTGNSLYAANNIAESNSEKLISIAAAVNSGAGFYEYKLNEGEMIGFVFPVYAWGPPKIVLEFIEGLKLNNSPDNYVFSVATCGDSIGNTMKVMDKSLKKAGMQLSSGFSIRMPNNYILMGDVDSKEVENEKLAAADKVLKDINDDLKKRTAGVFKLEKGSVPWLLTGFINPMFNKNAININKFYANDDCTGCGICEKVCNCGSIKVNEGPQWNGRCTQCMACINYCPERAIQYGKNTGKKGRYTNPNIKL